MIKCALVIGASGGIGSACVDELQSKGYQVDKWDRQQLDLDRPADIFSQDFKPSWRSS